jgi:hypothetical protein
MIPRSARRERRDTVLALPAIGALKAMPPETRGAVAGVLADLARNAGAQTADGRLLEARRSVRAAHRPPDRAGQRAKVA